LISLITLFLVFSILASDFLTLGTLSLILKQGSVLAIVATGLTFVLLCGEIDLSVGNVALLSACLCGVLWESYGGSKQGTTSGSTVAVCMALPLICAITFGLISGCLTILSRLPSFIITLAMMNIAKGLARFLTRGQTFAMPPMFERLGNNRLFEFSVMGFGTLAIPQIAVLAAIVMILAHLVLQHTRFGRYVYMTGGNRQAALLAGIRTERIVIACLGICAYTSAWGGMLTAGRIGGATINQNTDLLLDAVACVVLGGTSLFGGEGSIGRTLIGVLSFTVLTVGLNLTNVERLIKQLPIPAGLRDSWLRATWVTEFDQLRPFLMGLVLMLALVIHGQLTKRRRES
jgi:ribose transport system permease protein